jgi:hypothetical protein
MAEFSANLAANQFGLCANLVGSQFESGLDPVDRENRIIGTGCPRRRRHQLPKHEGAMKIKVAVLSALILLAATFPVLAKKNPPRPFFLRDAVTLNGAQVPAGIYELTWETHGSTARVSLSKNGQFVATAPAVWSKNGLKYAEDQALLRVNSDGTRSLIEIRIAGEARAIVFADADAPVHYSAMKH